MLILNLKTYPESAGEANAKLLKAVREVKAEYGETVNQVYVAPSMLELKTSLIENPELNIIAQSVDAKSPGSTTGWTPAKNLSDLGIRYALYNHSEHRMWSDTIIDDIKTIQQTGIKLIVCCENTQEALNLLEAQPFALAYEPKELIGSGRSVSSEKPEVVKEFVDAIKGKSLALIGAGVSTTDDIRVGFELGAEGFLLASAFVKAEDPKAKLIEFLKGGYLR